MRTGHTLTELIVVLSIAAIVAMIAVPRVAAIGDAAAVRDETIRVVAALEATRGTALRLDEVATLEVTATSYRAVAVVASDSVVAWSQPGPAANGVTITGAGSGIAFGPAGLAIGVSNRTITLSRGNAARRVVVSRLGRVTY